MTSLRAGLFEVFHCKLSKVKEGLFSLFTEQLESKSTAEKLQ